MLALQACRSSSLATAPRSLLTLRRNQTDALNVLVDALKAPDRPPMPGPEGYPNPIATTSTSVQSQILAKPRYRLHCHSSRNNTINTLTKPDGSPIAWASGGSCGFKKGNRATYEAGYQCAVRLFQKLEDISRKELIEVDLFFKGFGQGRDALNKAIMTSEGENIRPLIASITDRTPIKIGGTRAKKMRRL